MTTDTFDQIDDYELQTGFQRWQGGDIRGSKYFPKISWSALLGAAVLCGVFLVTSFHRLDHAQIWGHVAAGRAIVEAGRLPDADPFVLPQSTHDYLPLFWLPQIAAFGLHRLGGGELLVVAHALLVAASCGLTMLAIRRRGLSDFWAVIGGLAALAMAAPMLGTAGPHLAGAVGLPLVLLAWNSLARSRLPLYWLPPVFLIWTNSDPSVLVGLTVLALLCGGEVLRAARWHWRTALTDPLARRYAFAVLLALLAAMIHPAGPRALAGYAYLATSPAAEHSRLWQPLVIGSLSGAGFFASLLATAVLLRISPRRLRGEEVLLLVLLAAAALNFVSLLLWWAIVWSWIAAPHAAAAWERWGPRRRPQSEEDEPLPPTTMQTLIAMGFVFMTVLLSPPAESLLMGQPLGAARIATLDTPLFMADELQRRGIEGPIFVTQGWADYLIWHSGGRLRPLVHSRLDRPARPLWNDYKHLDDGRIRWREIADYYGLCYLVLSRASNPHLLRAVLRDERCEVLYQDDLGLLVKLLPAEAES